ncbi:MAG: GIY-YIG nuclease family protein [Lachnospiraceae bacterium]|nr:GIY-YIG nuclease family protein [Lachnospiraceae bacterium]
MDNFTYILECNDGSYYCGWTNDLHARIASHNAGKGGKYTRSRLPVKLVYYEAFPTKEEAMSREWHIKKLSRAEKIQLIRGYADHYVSDPIML